CVIQYSYPMMIGKVKELKRVELDCKPEEYLELYKKSIELNKNKTYDATFNLHSARLRLLLEDENQYVDIVKQYMFNNVEQIKIKKQKQNYMDNININPSEIALVQDNDLKPIWDDIYFGLVYSLSIYEYAH